MGSMCSINDFLKDNISKLYKIKTFNETQKKDLESKINQIMSRNVESFEHIWDQIDKDVDLLKKEIYDRLDNAKMSLKERYLRSMKMMKSFYNELKTKVNESEPRDVAGELDAMLERVKKEEVDPLDVIENIGNKVAVDIIEIEALNYEFEKSRSFVDFIFNGYETVRVATIPTYVSIQKDIEELVDKVEILSIPKIKATLQEPAKEIDSLLIYYESLIANDLGKELVERTMTEYLLQHDRDARSMQDDSYEAAMKEDKKLRSKKKKQSEPKVPPHVLYPNKTIHGPVSPVKDSSLRNSLNSSVQSQFSNPPSFYQKNSFLSNLNPSDADLDSSERNLLVPKTHDGALLSIPQDCDLDGLEKKATIAVTQDGKDFTPVIYILNNKFMISSFQKKESANSVAYGYRIYSISEDQKGECKSSLVYSSEALLLGKFKISHISCLERDSDDTNLLCLSTEEGFIYIFKFVIGEGDNFIFEIENTVVPKNSTNSVTCMRKLARTDYIIYTNTKGDIMTYDTIKGEVIASENICQGAISSSCFVQESKSFLIGSGSQEGAPNDNSLTFFILNYVKDPKQFGVEIPTFKYKVRVKKAHGDKYGVLAVCADNDKNNPLIFSAGGVDDPFVKVWNFDSKELIYTIESKDTSPLIFMNLIVFRQIPGDLPDKEPRGAWKKRAEEQTSYKKLRDEKKRKKTVAPDENSQAYLLLGVSAKGLRGVKVNLRGKSKSDSKEVHIPLETRAKFGTNILQSCQTGEDTVVTYAATSNGHIEVFKVKMTPIN